MSAAAPPAAFRLEGAGEGRLAAHGALTFASARAARLLGLAALGDGGRGALEIDCQGVESADSAGLAVLIDWLGAARGAGRSLRYRGLPADLTALARISQVEEVLAKGV
jgi:phospholipid transport system transporter-binding protein